MISTVGHGTTDPGPFTALLRGAGVAEIVDVRRFPGSRRHPHLGGEEMARWLAEAGIGYRWLPSLGGRRRARADSPNVALRNPQFRAYADHMATSEFAEGVAELVHQASEDSSAVMCAESLWWRCHRRLRCRCGLRLHQGSDGRHPRRHTGQPERRDRNGNHRHRRH